MFFQQPKLYQALGMLSGQPQDSFVFQPIILRKINLSF